MVIPNRNLTKYLHHFSERDGVLHPPIEVHATPDKSNREVITTLRTMDSLQRMMMDPSVTGRGSWKRLRYLELTGEAAQVAIKIRTLARRLPIAEDCRTVLKVNIDGEVSYAFHPGRSNAYAPHRRFSRVVIGEYQ